MWDRREVRAAGLGMAVVAAYLALVLLSGRIDLADFGRLFLVYLRGSFSLWLLLALAGLLWLLYVNRPRSGEGASPAGVIRDWLKRRWERDRLISLFWPPLLFAALMAAFNAFKQMILPAAGFRFDPLFADMDRALFFGQDPWRITHAVFGSPAATALIDKAYHGWFVPMALGLMLCAWAPRATFRLTTGSMVPNGSITWNACSGRFDGSKQKQNPPMSMMPDCAPSSVSATFTIAPP